MKIATLAAVGLVVLSAAPGLSAEPPLQEYNGWRHAISDLRDFPVTNESRHIKDFEGLLARVNSEVNKIDFVPDDAVYAKGWHYWPTEIEFVNFGGMCRDYATEKYRVLRRAGIADADMEIAVVIINKTQELHAVLTVRHQSKLYVLDNIKSALQNEKRMEDFTPVYFLNRKGWRDNDE